MRNLSSSQPRELLIVDDDLLFADSIKLSFENEDTVVSTANSLIEARSKCLDRSFDVVLLDNQLPDGSGLELLPDVLSANDNAKIILATAFPTFDHAVKAIKEGAYDYISKPVDLEELSAAFERAFQASRLQAIEQVAKYKNEKQRREAVLVGFKSDRDKIHDLVRRSAASEASVLITGETGTGKNVIAKMIHHLGHGPACPMITINCSALPETLIESELFGVEKGAFTGATQTKKGLFELADGGTLFLDEIGEMPAVLQAKLLSAIEDRKIRRVGGEKERSINARIIAATNAEPEKAIDEGKFRSDLFYRLSVIRIHIPSLRERKEDLPELCDHFLKKFSPGKNIRIPEAEMDVLSLYHFPGNVRELKNIIERSLILQEGDLIFPSQLVDVKEELRPTVKAVNIASDTSILDSGVAAGMTLTELERRYIIAVYEGNGRNLARASNALGISFSTVKRKLHSFGLR